MNKSRAASDIFIYLFDFFFFFAAKGYRYCAAVFSMHHLSEEKCQELPWTFIAVTETVWSILGI